MCLLIHLKTQITTEADQDQGIDKVNIITIMIIKKTKKDNYNHKNFS